MNADERDIVFRLSDAWARWIPLDDTEQDGAAFDEIVALLGLLIHRARKQGNMTYADGINR